MIKNKSNDPIKSSHNEQIEHEINGLLTQIQSKLNSVGIQARILIESNQTIPFHGLSVVDKNTSDGYHTFEELYNIRKAYNVALFNQWAKAKVFYIDGTESHPMYHVHKSKRHYDGELCFGGDWFVVCSMLPTGQITNHYHISDWDLFCIPETEKALFKFDGHSTQDVIQRLLDLVV